MSTDSSRIRSWTFASRRTAPPGDVVLLCAVGFRYLRVRLPHHLVDRGHHDVGRRVEDLHVLVGCYRREDGWCGFAWRGYG